MLEYIELRIKQLREKYREEGRVEYKYRIKELEHLKRKLLITRKGNHD